MLSRRDARNPKCGRRGFWIADQVQPSRRRPILYSSPAALTQRVIEGSQFFSHLGELITLFHSLYSKYFSSLNSTIFLISLLNSPTLTLFSKFRFVPDTKREPRLPCITYMAVFLSMLYESDTKVYCTSLMSEDLGVLDDYVNLRSAGVNMLHINNFVT